MGQLIKQLWQRYQSVLSYLIFGGLTTLINIIVFGIFNQFWPYWIANTIAWLISVLFAYITNKIWVFDSQTPTFRAVLIEMTSFFGFRLLSYFIDQGIMIVGISVLHGNDLIVKLIDQIIVVLLNWFSSKLFIVKDRGH